MGGERCTLVEAPAGMLHLDHIKEQKLPEFPSVIYSYRNWTATCTKESDTTKVHRPIPPLTTTKNLTTRPETF